MKMCRIVYYFIFSKKSQFRQNGGYNYIALIQWLVSIWKLLSPYGRDAVYCPRGLWISNEIPLSHLVSEYSFLIYFDIVISGCTSLLSSWWFWHSSGGVWKALGWQGINWQGKGKTLQEWSKHFLQFDSKFDQSILLTIYFIANVY